MKCESDYYLVMFIDIMLMFIWWYKEPVLLMLGEQLCQTPDREIKHFFFSRSSEASLPLTLRRHRKLHNRVV